jgi:hypothetical protein
LWNDQGSDAISAERLNRITVFYNSRRQSKSVLGVIL